MFGHDMSWASFHVLEVMSSSKYLQKRVGYLGAVQSFRTDTEVLMLATNLLKKDLVSASPTTMTLPIIALPHLITNSLAMSVLSDLLPRLTHSSPFIRKKTVVTLYRLALVYPETLRSAWPKIKERLMDENEDPSVTSAIVNVICELGWRRPQDFLPLAPRLFELLVDGGNNWMAIKLIKLFATMTPLEPRLVKKLLPPLTSIIRTTPAMSLLYECINGIIQGGILDASDAEGDEIATLCVSKLRGMIMVEGDPNLKYVALLAFNKIVTTHPFLVAQQEDVIMDCIDSPDMSIRLRALDLVVGMVSSDNLTSIVGRLMRQLHASDASNGGDQGRSANSSPALSEDEQAGTRRAPTRAQGQIPLSDEYRTDVIQRILAMCSSQNYANLTDFEWYIDILVQLVRSIPQSGIDTDHSQNSETWDSTVDTDVSEVVGREFQNVAVKVRALRPLTTRAAESVILDCHRGTLSQNLATTKLFRPLSWLVGEYGDSLAAPQEVLNAILQFSKMQGSSEVLATYLQCLPKILSCITKDLEPSRETQVMLPLLVSRVLDVLGHLAAHPDLEVQERAVEYLELLRLASEACVTTTPANDGTGAEIPLLLSQAIPSLFTGLELQSVALTAQENVNKPNDLDLDETINQSLVDLLRDADSLSSGSHVKDEIELYYFEKMSSIPAIYPTTAADQIRHGALESATSYQNITEEHYFDPDIVARRRAERLDKNRDDPFYIAPTDGKSITPTALDTIIEKSNGNELDVDSIPIMQLDLGDLPAPRGRHEASKEAGIKRTKVYEVAADQTLPGSGHATPGNDDSETSLEGKVKHRPQKSAKSHLFVDSSIIGSFSLEDPGGEAEGKGAGGSYEEDEEMAKAMREVERLRLEMQRANERIQTATGVPPEGTVVKKKKKASSKKSQTLDENGEKPKKKAKKPKRVAVIDGGATTSDTSAPVEHPKSSGSHQEAHVQ
jgi:AP-3 complex subunit delta-1